MLNWKCVPVGLAAGMLLMAGCANANRNRDDAAAFVARMDALPPEEQVPNWDNTRALMARQAPQPGEAAPDITLEAEDGSGPIRLSEFRGSRPVVLIFGSWT